PPPSPALHPPDLQAPLARRAPSPATACGAPFLAPGHGPDDQERLDAGGDRLGERIVRRVLRQVLFAGEESHEGPALLRNLVADRPAEHRIARLERVEDRARRDGPCDLELQLAVGPGQRPQMRGQHEPDHGSGWTPTETPA